MRQTQGFWRLALFSCSWVLAAISVAHAAPNEESPAPPPSSTSASTASSPQAQAPAEAPPLKPTADASATQTAEEPAAGPDPAEAPPNPAHVLLEEGRGALERGELDLAIGMLERSQRLAPSVAALTLLANAHERRGDLLAALRETRRRLALARGLGPAPEQEARQTLVTLKNRLPRLRIVLPRSTTKATIRVDDQVIRLSNLEFPLELNPGPHTIHVQTAHGRRERSDFVLAEGKRFTFEIPLLWLTPPPAPKPALLPQQQLELHMGTAVDHGFGKPGVPVAFRLTYAHRVQQSRLEVFGVAGYTVRTESDESESEEGAPVQCVETSDLDAPGRTLIAIGVRYRVGPTWGALRPGLAAGVLHLDQNCARAEHGARQIATLVAGSTNLTLEPSLAFVLRHGRLTISFQGAAAMAFGGVDAPDAVHGTLRISGFAGFGLGVGFN